MSECAYLAIDFGAESGRALIGVIRSGRLELAELHRIRHEPSQDETGLHWNLEVLLDFAVESVALAIEWAASGSVCLVSVGVDTWGVDFALISSDGNVLESPIAYRDPRHERGYQQVLQTMSAQEIYRLTGNQLMPFNTLFQLATLQRERPELLAQARHLLFMPDLFQYLLSGCACIEETIASTSQMRCPSTGHWAIGMLDRLGIPHHFLSPPIAAGTCVGPLRESVINRLQQRLERRHHAALAALRVTVPAGHDTANAVAAVPARQCDRASDRWCFVSSGTWSVFGAELQEPCISESARLAPFSNELGVCGTTRFVQNINGLWILQRVRHDLQARGSDFDYEELARLAAVEQPCRSVVRPDDPTMSGTGPMIEAIADFCVRTDQPIPETPGQLARCCLDSLALSYRYALSQLEGVLGRRFEVIHIVGGGSRNTLLNQLTADACGRCVISGPDEATAIGNLLIQAMAHEGSGITGLACIRRVVGNSFELKPFDPAPEMRACWEEAWGRLHLSDRGTIA